MIKDFLKIFIFCSVFIVLLFIASLGAIAFVSFDLAIIHSFEINWIIVRFIVVVLFCVSLIHSLL